MREADRAREYAHGLYKAATDPLLEQLGRANDAIEGQPQIGMMLDDPSVEFANKAARLAEVLPPGTNKEVHNLLSLLISRNEIGLLGQVVEEFRQRVKGGRAPMGAEITSAVALTDDERSTIEQRIRATYGTNVQFNYKVNPEILGGLIIQAGDKILDGSVQAKLARLREQIISAL